MKRTNALLPMSIETNKANQKNRLARLRESEDLQAYLKGIKNRLAGGKTFDECRQELEIKSDTLWGDILTILAQTHFNAERNALQYKMKMDTRYTILADVLKNAIDEKNDKKKMEVIRDMQRIDESAIQYLNLLGLIKPIKLDGGGEGFDSKDIESVEVKVDEYIKRIEYFKRDTESISIDVFTKHEPQQQTNRLDQTPMVNTDTQRSEPSDTNTQGITNGSEHVLHPVVDVVGERKENT